ncbi:DUF7017 domain-containing protein [Psychroserpens sp. NJDZ02]|uniref:DUF7017 domain-containing protein n=1 Tax=Psychroserpens sp. NJDZ02 TaxID=2570561 RepID=UPI0010A829E9|nr:hypothetical protein [Psychroserpens sp. NJDZ02]QCE42399.1 hypothetical protein E9099_13620 [Psychroserpens sp. NJDZ02]
MPAKDIKELRESGKLEEALIMAKNEFDVAPDNIWTKRNLAWVYYSLLKKHQGNQDDFLSVLIKIIELKLPENENMFYEQLCWAVGMHNFKISKDEEVAMNKFSAIKSVFYQVRSLSFVSSKGYSFLLKSFHNEFKGIKNSSGFNTDNFINFSESYRELILWSGFNSFGEEDFLPNEVNGRKIISFVEQIIIAYSKVLLEGEPLKTDEPNENLLYLSKRSINASQVDSFLFFLNKIINLHPEYQYTLYYKSKLLLALNRLEEAKNSLIPFVKQKKNDFWVWELLSEAFPEDVDLQIGCLCKGLTLNAKESFLVKVHEKLANLLIQKELFLEASIEILNTCLIRKKNNWKITNDLTNLMNQGWYNKEVVKNGNTDFYLKHSKLAEELLYNNHEEIVIVVEHINDSKKVVNFIKNKQVFGFFSYKHLNINPEVGSVFKVRLNQIGEEGFFKVLTIKLCSQSVSESVSSVSGNLRILENKNFGFIQDVFITPDLIDNNHLKNGDIVNAKTILSFNKKRNEWGWKAFKVAKD